MLVIVKTFVLWGLRVRYGFDDTAAGLSLGLCSTYVYKGPKTK